MLGEWVQLGRFMLESGEGVAAHFALQLFWIEKQYLDSCEVTMLQMGFTNTQPPGRWDKIQSLPSSSFHETLIRAEYNP
ncbi:hypothetical protein Y1Q_0020025 [Alligator mississippiensis]|uniref:Uncharacterized protein n=1 Tax=Alligator mississippiensis TaxID=8496 RepID=A0A151LYT9_ALLMI|nr:hypothetical protein Y1Q_0020025 [Alligator mississippiensis]